MSFDYSTLITNRARSDSDTLKTLLSKPMAEWTAEERTAFNGAVMRGSYDYTDFNRVDACLEDLVARLGRVGCNVPGYERLKIPRTAHPSGRLPHGLQLRRSVRSGVCRTQVPRRLAGGFRQRADELSVHCGVVIEVYSRL